MSKINIDYFNLLVGKLDIWRDRLNTKNAERVPWDVDDESRYHEIIFLLGMYLIHGDKT